MAAEQYDAKTFQSMMRDKAKGLNMDRNKLICAHFDAYSDLVWVTNP